MKRLPVLALSLAIGALLAAVPAEAEPLTLQNCYDRLDNSLCQYFKINQPRCEVVPKLRGEGEGEPADQLESAIHSPQYCRDGVSRVRDLCDANIVASDGSTEAEARALMHTRASDYLTSKCAVSPCSCAGGGCEFLDGVCGD